MKTRAGLILLAASAVSLMAQGPGGPGRPGGFGPFGGRGMAIAGMGPGESITGAPYSALQVVQSQTVLGDGNRISNRHQVQVYRDSQGRIRTEETVTPPADSGKAPFTMITIVDPVAGMRTVLNSAEMKAMQTPMPQRRGGGGQRPGGAAIQPPPDRGPRPAGQQRVVTNLGTQSINGVAATGRQVTETIPAGAIGNAQPIIVSRTTWVSDSLRIPIQIKSSDPRFGNMEMELTNISTAEPNATLFVVPAGYTLQTRPAMRGGGGPPMQPRVRRN